MSEDVSDLKKMRAELGAKASVTKIAFEANLNPQTVYAALRGKAGENTIERVRKTLRNMKALKTATAS